MVLKKILLLILLCFSVASFSQQRKIRILKSELSYTDEDNMQDAYGLLNGRVSFYSANQSWEVALWGKNLLDEAYKGNLIASSDSVAGILMTVRGEPRTYGLEAIYRF